MMLFNNNTLCGFGPPDVGTENTIGNETICPDDYGFGDPSPVSFSPNFVQMAQILSRTVTASIALSGIFLNYLVFQATRNISSKNLKSKTLIQNSIIADTYFGIGALLILIRYIIQAYGAPIEATRTASYLTNQLNAGALYIQVFTSGLLACDRMYAVVRPMTYHTIGYSKLANVALVLLPWLGAIALMLTGICIKFFDKAYEKEPYYIKLYKGFFEFTYPIKASLAIGVNAFIFAFYIVIFIAFTVQKRLNRAVQGSTSEKTGKTLSLTLTYFFTHLSTLCLYLPGPIFNLLSDKLPTSVLSRPAWGVINQIMVMLYMTNIVVNPIILASRVRQIGKNLSQFLQLRIPEEGKNTAGTTTTTTTSTSRQP